MRSASVRRAHYDEVYRETLIAPDEPQLRAMAREIPQARADLYTAVRSELAEAGEARRALDQPRATVSDLGL